jgi:hypothetical protein
MPAEFIGDIAQRLKAVLLESIFAGYATTTALFFDFHPEQ